MASVRTVASDQRFCCQPDARRKLDGLDAGFEQMSLAGRMSRYPLDAGTHGTTLGPYGSSDTVRAIAPYAPEWAYSARSSIKSKKKYRKSNDMQIPFPRLLLPPTTKSNTMTVEQHSAAVTVLDGGMSRELVRLGARLRQPEWSALALMETPAIVQKVHEEFALAGADVVTTNSYALVPYHIGDEVFAARGHELASLAGQLAFQGTRQAAAGKTNGHVSRVAGCLPPVFGSYEPAQFRPDTVQKYLAVLTQGLEPFVDLWLGETLSLIDEARAVQEAVRDSAKPLWIAFSLADADEKLHRPPTLRSGEPVSVAAEWALAAGIDALLFNCSRPEFMTAAIATTHAIFAAARPHHNHHPSGVAAPAVPRIGVYANAFVPREPVDKANATLTATCQDLCIDAYAAFARDWVAHGATIVGGCCGIGARHVERLVREFAH